MRQHPNVLVRIAERLLPFTSTDGRAFVQFPVGLHDGQISFAVHSDTCRTWFDRHYFVETDRVASPRIHHDFCRHLESQALYGPYRGVMPVYRRAASLDGRIFIDLANEDADSIEITADGHRIHHGSDGPAFETSATTLPLPEPTAPASEQDPLDQLRRLLRVEGHAWFRILCWLLSAWSSPASGSTGPMPILILRGPARSGKSLAARILRALVDPSSSPFTATPRSAANLLNLARQNWVLAFDHIASLSPAISDTLCRLSSGVAVAHREPGHTEHCQQSIRRPILLTVTDRFVPSPDLAARALIVDLPALASDAVRPEPGLAEEFAALRPQVLDALCTALSRALKASPEAYPTDAFPEIAAALASPPPAHPFVRDVLALLSAVPNRHWEGTAEQLLLLLPVAETPKGVSQALNAHLLALAQAGIRVTRDRKTHRRLLTLDFHQDASYSPEPSMTSATSDAAPPPSLLGSFAPPLLPPLLPHENASNR